MRGYLPGLGSLGVTGGRSGLRRRRPNSRTDGSRAGGLLPVCRHSPSCAGANRTDWSSVLGAHYSKRLGTGRVLTSYTQARVPCVEAPAYCFCLI